ncbi:hypothetical protein Nepgr_001400 [Nepenthes gracilis]|uniref:TF-B3 domain-containing protein n=1 Tax=Nepenthes gracilis TaxID=150966 RepID=A0AAD3P4E4_NEPGR|nr:hypothetical protein Nepgr_001400 [Nepenthes gracilis]
MDSLCRRGFGLNHGWKEFALDNFLEEHDVCLFKLASQKLEPMILDVSIFRAVSKVTPLTPSSISDHCSCDCHQGIRFNGVPFFICLFAAEFHILWPLKKTVTELHVVKCYFLVIMI